MITRFECEVYMDRYQATLFGKAFDVKSGGGKSKPEAVQWVWELVQELQKIEAE